VGVLIRRTLLIVNPAARRARVLRHEAEAAFQAAGASCDVVMTERPGHGAAVAGERCGSYDAVFTLGGDGTAMEVVGALAGRGVPVGLLPGGTGNLIARTVGVPLRVRRAVPALLGGDQADVDLGVFRGDGPPRHFAFAAGVGIDADMIELAPARLKRRLGVLAYVVSATKAVLRRREFGVRVTVDGQVVERRASAVMIANFGAVLNELITLGPGIKQDDGVLDLCIFSPRSVADAVRVVWRLSRRDFREDPSLLYRPGRHFRVETDPPLLAEADGDLVGRAPFEVTVAPLAARLLVPRAPAA
jgi:diacylglycerol kinase (ATP)